MRSEDLKYMLPDIPDEISDRMRSDIESCIENNAKISRERKNSSLVKAAACFAAILMVGTTAYAANYAIKMKSEKEGNYGVNIGIATEGTTESLTQDAVYHSFTWNYGAKPDGMDEYPNAEGKLNDKYKNDRYFTPEFINVDKSVDFAELHLGHVVSQGEVSVNGIPAQRIEFTDGRVWYYMLYEDKGAILVAMTGKDLSFEDFEYIMSGFEVNEAEEISSEEAFKWSDYVEQMDSYNIDYDYGSVDIASYSSEDLDNLFSIGDKYETTTFDGEMGDVGITVNVSDVEVYDNLSVLNKDVAMFECPEYYDAIDENGKLLPNTVYAYKAGDGVDKLDEIISQETLDERLVYATIEFTNTSDKTINDVWFFAEKSFIKEDTDNYYITNIYSDFRFQNLEDYAYAAHENIYDDYWEMAYYDVKDSIGKNYIPEIKPGETATVHVGFMVSADELPYLVMSVNNTFDSTRITDSDAWYDLRNITAE